MSTENMDPAGAPECAEKRLKRPPRLVRNRNVARVRLNGRDLYCGAWGSNEARKRYRELIAEWNEHDCKLPTVLDDADPEAATVDEIVALYDAHELPTRPASMQERIKAALAPLQEHYGSRLACEFSALDLTALRVRMATAPRKRGDVTLPPLTRGMVNQRVSFIRAMFAWAAAMGRIDERAAFRLSVVKGLRRGPATREGRKVQPIDWKTVEATTHRVAEPVRGLALFQWYTGARPGEACALTADAIDRSGKVWIYTPAHHKTEHHGKSRHIHIGAEGQAVLRPFLVRRPADKPLFSPKEAIAQQKADAASQRRTPVQPSQEKRRRQRAARPRREIAEGYTVDAYRRALDRGVDAANAEVRQDSLRQHLLDSVTDPAVRADMEDAISRVPVFVSKPCRDRLVRRLAEALGTDKAGTAALAKVVDKVLGAPGTFERWHPHRLRHAFGHRVGQETADLDSLRAALGHSTLAMTQRYAHIDDNRKARELAERIG